MYEGKGFEYTEIMLKYLNIFILVIGVRLIEAVDCDDGNKGGCSHVCFQSKSFDCTINSVYIIFKDMCRCPKCWELDDSGLNCLPETGKVKSWLQMPTGNFIAGN